MKRTLDPRPPETAGRYAGLIPRGVSYLFDCAVAFGVFAGTQLLLFSPLRAALGIGDDWFRSGVNTELYTLLTISIPVWLYFAVFESSPWRATPGKRLMKLRVVDDPAGTQIAFPRALLRTVLKLLPWEIAHLTNNLPEPMWYAPESGFRIGFALVGVLVGVYAATAARTAKKQAPHDLAAKTVVLKGRAGGD